MEGGYFCHKISTTFIHKEHVGNTSEMLLNLLLLLINVKMLTFNVLRSGSICLELLPQISCPTLIIHGEKDPMVPSVHPQCLLKHIKGSR